MKESVKSDSGTYVVVLKSSKTGKLQIGKYGELDLGKGYYVYVGSAFGPGGIKSRLNHHTKVSSSPHWHIDYLRKETTFHKAYAVYSYEHKECDWATRISEDSNSIVPLRGFGSSDCKCTTHLYRFKTFKMVNDVVSKLGDAREVFV